MLHSSFWFMLTYCIFIYHCDIYPCWNKQGTHTYIDEREQEWERREGGRDREGENEDEWLSTTHYLVWCLQHRGCRTKPTLSFSKSSLICWCSCSVSSWSPSRSYFVNIASISASVWSFLKLRRGYRWARSVTWSNPNTEISKCRRKGETAESGTVLLLQYRFRKNSATEKRGFCAYLHQKFPCHQEFICTKGILYGLRSVILTLWDLVEVHRSLTCLRIVADSLKCHPRYFFLVLVWPRLYGSPVEKKGRGLVFFPFVFALPSIYSSNYYKPRTVPLKKYVFKKWIMDVSSTRVACKESGSFSKSRKTKSLLLICECKFRL